jgi:hypothetical protein
MSHITVGERMIGQGPQVLGHIVRGGGHFIEQGQGLVQQFAPHMPAITTLVNNSLDFMNGNVDLNSWQWNTLASNYGNGSLMASNAESAAVEAAWKESINDLFSATKDSAMAVLSALGGDSESAVAYGTDALEKMWNSDAKLAEAIWGAGPTPGQGTCPPAPDNGR